MTATAKTYALRAVIATRTGIELSYEQAATLRRAEKTLHRFIVQDRYESGAWRTYYAPDVTSLRRALRTREEIIQA